MMKRIQHETDNNQLLFSVPRAAAVLDMGTSTLYEMMKRGELPFVKIGTARRLHRDDILALANKHRVDPEAAA